MSESADKGVEKGALLLLSWAEIAAEVLKHLGPKEAQKLSHAMANLKTIPRDKVEAVRRADHDTERGTAFPPPKIKFARC